MVQAKHNFAKELTLKYKRNTDIVFNNDTTLNSSKKLYNELFKLYDVDDIDVIETGYALYLDLHFRIIGYTKLGQGTFNAVQMDLKQTLINALLCGASNVVLTHNHPSGLMRPSNADIQLTKNIRIGCEAVGLKLVDHLIISPTVGIYFSFMDEYIEF